MNKVFLVTESTWDYFGILRVFSTRELADEYLKTINTAFDYSYYVEEWVVDEVN